MTNISLTDFMEFVTKTGPTKYTKVKQIKGRDKYHPALDFWKPLRDAIIEFHTEEKNRAHFDNLLQSLSDKNKVKSYPELVSRYKSFLGRKTIKWFTPPKGEWKHNDLRIKLNPELGLTINDKKFAIKLYFKSEQLSQMKVDLIILLLNEKLKKPKDVNFAVLDVKHKKFFSSTKLTESHLSLLEGEALSFMQVWMGF